MSNININGYGNCVYKIERDGHRNQGIIYLRTWDDNGEPITERHVHKSCLYVESATGKYNSIFKTKLKKIEFDTVFDKYRYAKENKQSKRIFQNITAEKEFLLDQFEGYQESPEMFKNKLKVYSLDIEVAVERDGQGFPDAQSARFPINVICINDKETKKDYNWVVRDPRFASHNTATFVDNSVSKYFVFTSEAEMLSHFVNWFNINAPNALTDWNGDTYDMPYIIHRIQKVCPFGTEHRLSPIPDGVVKNVKMKDKVSQKEFDGYTIEGVAHLDYKFLYKDKFNTIDKKPDYKLETICQIELGVGKLKYEGSIIDFWQNDLEKWVEYCRIDTKRVMDLEYKFMYVEIARMLTTWGLCIVDNIYSSAPYLYGAITLQGRAMDKIVISSQPSGATYSDTDEYDDDFEGAFVFPARAGVYTEGIASYDLNSLYPMVIDSLNISIETKVLKVLSDFDYESDTCRVQLADGNIKNITKEQLEKITKRCSVSGNKVYYLKSNSQKGVVPSFISRSYAGRVDHKNIIKKLEQDLPYLTDAKEIANNKALQIYHDSCQYCIKIMMNSIYGSLGNKYFPLYDIDNAEAVTLSGQMVTKSAATFINKWLKIKHPTYFKEINRLKDNEFGQVAYGDTDSVYIDIAPITHDFGGKITDENRTDIAIVVDKLGDDLNKFTENHTKKIFNLDVTQLSFGREAFCYSAMFFAKKRYVLRVANMDAKKTRDGDYVWSEKFKYTGVEVKKSEHPENIKTYMKHVIESNLVEGWTFKQYCDEIDKIWEEYQTLPANDIAIYKGYNTAKELVGGLTAEKGTMAAPKGVLYHNRLVKELELDHLYQDIMVGDRARLSYIKKSNEYGINIIAWQDEMYQEFDDLFDLNYELMFEKTFLNTLKSLRAISGWGDYTPSKAMVFDIFSL